MGEGRGEGRAGGGAAVPRVVGGKAVGESMRGDGWRQRESAVVRVRVRGLVCGGVCAAGVSMGEGRARAGVGGSCGQGLRGFAAVAKKKKKKHKSPYPDQ